MPCHAMCTAIASKLPSLRSGVVKHAIALATSSQTRDPGEDTRAGPGYVVDTEPDLSCDEVIPGLYLGSQDVAAASDILR